MKKSETKNPWKTLESQVMYDNPWIKVTEHQVINPSGNAGIYGIVSFKNIAIGIVPLDEAYNTWLVGQYRYALGAYSWEIPEGGCLIGKETKLGAAQRELQEETGLVATQWTEILEMHTSNSVTDEVGYAFVAQGLTLGEATPEDTEELQLKKLPFEEAIALCMNGTITDSLSVLALFKTKLLLDQKLL
ncbi:NUDIX domain-containing protein [Aureispira anguillae]|uniref:GDP-mannose pyrophosphatase n=1 Tax=Aureispira anguillae TaxID=2864201 RepID=A0A915YIN7_9BACT|nr:NUDIX hydrolase [Aureispira anguillae]BDS13770.1 NUDIX hydrolase [Aureispira anguillae]